MHFGERLKSLRNNSGKSQKEVAEDLDVTQARISYLERQENAPKESTIKILANYYSVPITYFYSKKPEPVSDNTLSYLDELSQKPVEAQENKIEMIMHELSGLTDSDLERVRTVIKSLAKNSNE